MARPQKRGLDYFPMDVDIDGDSGVAYLEAKYGSDGFTVWVKALCSIYGQEGYFMPWSERECYVFARQVGIPAELVEEVMKDAIEVELFDRQMFVKWGILTSAGIQRRFIHSTVRRAGVVMDAPYLLAKREAADAKHVEVVLLSAPVEAEPEIASTETVAPDKVVKKGSAKKEAPPKATVEEIVEYLNEKAGTRFRVTTPQTATFIGHRIRDGFSMDDFKAVIDAKVKDWKNDPKMCKFLRPETLFGNKFEGYLNERRDDVRRDDEPTGFRDGAELCDDAEDSSG